MKSVTVCLDDELHAKLKEIKKEHCINLSKVTQSFFIQYVKKMARKG